MTFSILRKVPRNRDLTYRLTRKAAEDLRHIHSEGKRLFGIRQANSYHLYLQSVFDILSENPELARERTEISPPVRIHPCGSHLVVYIKSEDASVLIVRVRHHRENWAS